ncbi:LysR family transcriptional regulator [Pseudonocardia xinjiangensis]|uniref:LysR family transcriptional regulator n=1 Tax=Pseudonocardia xinjiangensis TaxID=75289 RepID=A0ABX1RBA5_9PSEU|nr:LysR family transcriptional regulator [Pseudonocardia xinjiangensis]
MELRDIETFLTLAEELHFGRTAQRLHVTTARVSQVIKQQERRIGGQLFDRSTRTVRLTPLGAQLRDDLRPVYAGLLNSLERARQASRGITGTLRVGMIPFNTYDLRPFWTTFRTRHPQWSLQIRRASFVDPFAALRTGEHDILVAWLPVDEPDLTVGPVLFSDRRILAVSTDHELAARSSVSVEMLADFPNGSGERLPDYWEDAYLPFQSPRGLVIERRALLTNGDELIHLVALGETVQVFPVHVTDHWAMPDVRWLPITDLTRLRYALVWRTETEMIRAMARVVSDLGALQR